MSARLITAGLLAAGALALPAVAAAGTTDVSWSLGQSVTTYGSPFTVGSGASGGDYRWIDTLTKDTVISGNDCNDGSPFNVVAIDAGDTSYKRIVTRPVGTCFLLRGRVAAGQGSTTTRQGRVSR